MQYIEELEIEQYEMHPFYNRQNNAFFQKNIFLSEEDLHETRLSMREVFRNQKMNVNFFGNLYVLPNGDVKADMGSDTLANINDTGMTDLIYKELVANTAWRNVRNCAPCDRCIYQFICPPVSHYERALKRNNLCHIRE